MTRKQLRDRIIKEIGLQDIEDYDESALVDDLIHQGTIDVLARTRCTVRCIHLKTQADVGTYVLDKSILALVDLENGNVPRLRRDELRSSGSPSTVVVYPENYVPVNGLTGFTLVRSDILQLRPVPSQDGEVDVWAVIRPSRMTDDAHSPSQDEFGGIPEEYHDAIFLYACWQASSYADDESGANGERYRALYEGPDGLGGKVQYIKRMVNRRGTSRAPRRRIGSPSDQMVKVSSHRRYVG